jgi:exosortase
MTTVVDNQTAASVDPRNNSSAVVNSGNTTWMALLVLVIALAALYSGPLRVLAGRWANEPDYSHGFLVPIFAGYLLWRRRDMAESRTGTGFWPGVLLLILGAGTRLGALYLSYPLADAASLIPCTAGLFLLVGGWKWLAWAWPAVLFLVFMVPLPGAIAGMISSPLQRIATECSTYLLQTVGVPATAQGNVISLTEHQIGVVEACSGLRMLVAFSAITFAAACLVRAALWERIVIVLSAVPIGIISNVIRITVTGLAHEYVGTDAANYIFHDLAGWLMMPLAIGILAGMLYLFSVLFPERPAGPLVSASD